MDKKEDKQSMLKLTKTTATVCLMIILDELFCDVDDFCALFEPDWHKHLISCGSVRRLRSNQLSLSEIMTILIAFQTSGYRNFKVYYLNLVCQHYRSAFPDRVRYSRFIQLIPRVLVPMIHYLSCCKGSSTGIGFIDSTSIKVCHNRRIFSHRVFDGIAQRGRTSVDWFAAREACKRRRRDLGAYALRFKLHLVINDRGEILNFALTPGNVDDRKPVRELLDSLSGKFVGDKGYISEDLALDLRAKGIILITKFKQKMKNRLVTWSDKILMRKRALIESVIGQLKHLCHIEHTRHRSPINFIVHLLAGLIAYCHLPHKPSIAIDPSALPSSC